MSRQNLTAFTECTGYALYPAYISINRLGDGAVSVTVRGRDRSDCSEIVLSSREFEQLTDELHRVR